MARQIDELTGTLAGDDRQGDGYLAQVCRLTMARMVAEKIVLPGRVLPDPEPGASGDLDDEDNGDENDKPGLVPRPATFAPFLGGRCSCGRTPDPSICTTPADMYACRLSRSGGRPGDRKNVLYRYVRLCSLILLASGIEPVRGYSGSGYSRPGAGGAGLLHQGPQAP